MTTPSAPTSVPSPNFIQMHVLHVYSASCINRGDDGAPKSFNFGGTDRTRISSQCLRATWRHSEPFLKAVGDPSQLGTRTREIGSLLVYKPLIEGGVDALKAHQIAQRVHSVFTDKESKANGDSEPKKGRGKTKATKEGDTETMPDAGAAPPTAEGPLVFLTQNEMFGIAALVQNVIRGQMPTPTDFENLITDGKGTVGVAMFGRMMASRPRFNVHAALQGSDAFTVGAGILERDYRTAMDDLRRQDPEASGAAHLDEDPFSAGTYYHYLSIDRRLLMENLLGNQELACASVKGLLEAVLTVAPSGKQTRYGHQGLAAYALVEIGDYNRTLAPAFERPITGRDGHLRPAIDALETLALAQDKLGVVSTPARRSLCTVGSSKFSHGESPNFGDLLSFIDGAMAS